MGNTIKIVEFENGEQGFYIQDLLKGTNVNVKDVHFYTVESKGEGAVIVSLFDLNKKPIKIDQQS